MPPDSAEEDTSLPKDWLTIMKGGGRKAAELWQRLPRSHIEALNKEYQVAYLRAETVFARVPALPVSPSRIISDGEECRSRSELVTASNIFGRRLFRYSLTLKWCYEEGKITSSRYCRRVYVYQPFWEFAGHIERTVSGGKGLGWYEVYTQGHFRLCYLDSFCPSHQYPWVQIEAEGDGSSQSWRGG